MLFRSADPKWRRGRIRDVIITREILIEINEKLARGLHIRGAEFEDLAPDREAARSVFDSMPSFDVAVTLKTAHHRNPQHAWSENDIMDIDALGSTLPYRDIVVTDSAMESHAHQSKLVERLDTTVLSNLRTLAEHL